MIFDKELDENLKVCPKCQHHFPIGSRERIHSLVETCTFEEMDAEMTSVDVLLKVGRLRGKLERDRKNTMLKDAVVTGICKMGAHPVGAGRDGFRVHGRFDGRGRGRKTDPAHRARPRKAAGRSSSFPPAAARGCRKACSA